MCIRDRASGTGYIIGGSKKNWDYYYNPRIIKQIYEQPEALEQTIASEGTVTAVSAQPLIIKSEEKTAKIRYFFIIILIGINKYNAKIDYMKK